MEKAKKTFVVIVFIGLSSFSLSALGEGCVQTSNKDVLVQFTGFKTPKKVGVKGLFSSVKIKKHRGKSWQSAILNNEITIDASKISSGDAGRDVKIATFFFKGQSIRARFVKLNEKARTLVLSVTMNGVTQSNINMFYKVQEKTLVAKGQLDVLKFQMSKHLSDLTKACYEKHQGKTWPGVDVQLTVKMKPC